MVGIAKIAGRDLDDIAKVAGKVVIGLGDAAVGHVLAPKTFYAGNTTLKTGTMATVALLPDNPAYPPGYHAGAANLAAIDADLAVGNIKTGVNIFGYVGTYDTTASAPAAAQVILNKVCWANGAQITGTMLDESAAGITIVPSTIKQNLPAAGYWLTTDASVRVLGSAYLVGANIKSGVTIFGVTGTYDTSASPIAAARMRTNDEGWVNGSKITGSGTQAIASGSNNYVAGYHAGNGGGLSAIEASLATGNIKSGVNIFGYVGAATIQDISAANLTVAEAPTGKTFFAVTGGIKTGTGTKTLDPANDTVNAGYYAATTLSAVDAQLAAANIKSGVNIFGFVGVATVQEIGAADAAVTDVKAPRTFFSVTGAIKTGTMGDYSAAGITITPSTANQHLPNAGYWLTTDASVKVLGDADLAVGNIKTGVNIFGIVGTYDTTGSPIAAARMKTGDVGWANGAQITGTGTKTLSDANDTVAEGYYAATTLHAVDGDLAVGNIKSGITIFGFLGTYLSTMTITEDWVVNEQTTNSTVWANVRGPLDTTGKKIACWVGCYTVNAGYTAYSRITVDGVEKVAKSNANQYRVTPAQYGGAGGEVYVQAYINPGGGSSSNPYDGLHSVSVA